MFGGVPTTLFQHKKPINAFRNKLILSVAALGRRDIRHHPSGMRVVQRTCLGVRDRNVAAASNLLFAGRRSCSVHKAARLHRFVRLRRSVTGQEPEMRCTRRLAGSGCAYRANQPCFRSASTSVIASSRQPAAFRCTASARMARWARRFERPSSSTATCHARPDSAYRGASAMPPPRSGGRGSTLGRCSLLERWRRSARVRSRRPARARCAGSRCRPAGRARVVAGVPRAVPAAARNPARPFRLERLH